MSNARLRYEWGEPGLARQLIAFIAGAIVISSIAYLDARLEPEVSIGLLYIVPLIMVSPWLTAGQVTLLSAVCAILREHLMAGAWQGEWSGRLLVTFVVFAGPAICVSELARSRRLAQNRLSIIQEESSRRKDAEDRLRAIVDSSPLGVFALDAEGRVQMANGTALRLFGYSYDAELVGRSLKDHLPLLAELRGSTARDDFSVALECPGRRVNGEQFWAHIWLSKSGSKERPNLTLLVWDGSEIFRDREGSGWELLLTGSRLTMAAVAHEMKNLTVAAMRCEERVKAVAGPEAEPELSALRTSLNAIQEVAKGALAQARPGAVRYSCQLNGVIEEASILLAPLLEENGIEMTRDFSPASLPKVRGDRRALVQVIVNITENSARVLQGRLDRRIRWSVQEEESLVRLRFSDSGPGVDDPDALFQPFQSRAQQTGLGLAISRVMLRSFDGDLRYEKASRGNDPSFVIVLMKEGRNGASGSGGSERNAAQSTGR